MGPRRAALIALLVLACSACATTSAASTPSPVIGANGCRVGPPEAGVYRPDRLLVLDPCRHAAGVVVDVASEDDGDHHIWFTPDPGYGGLLNAENHFQGRPAMLAEITPDCEGNPPDSVAAIRCPKSGLAIPKLGDHIAIDGPWVLDTDHGWREIHPVDSIAFI